MKINLLLGHNVFIGTQWVLLGQVIAVLSHRLCNNDVDEEEDTSNCYVIGHAPYGNIHNASPQDNTNDRSVSRGLLTLMFFNIKF